MSGVESVGRAEASASIDLHLARRLARLAGERREEVVLAVARLSRVVREGHVCLDLRRPAAGAADTEVRAPDDWLELLGSSPLADDGGGGRPLVLEPWGALYLRRYWAAECELARSLRERASGPDLPFDADRLEADLARQMTGATGSQRRAASLAARRPLCIVSGGPGTGKTTLVRHLLDLLAEQPGRVAGRAPRALLLAPTGKAARRLEEAAAGAGLSHSGASTVHRALGARADGSFPDAPGAYLDADAVIVDEASMIDLPLMARLVAAVPARSRLVLLGDPHQLASVESGAVLADLCAAGPDTPPAPGLEECSVELDRVFRFEESAGLGRLAAAVREGDADAALLLLEDPACADVERIDPPARGLGEALAREVREIFSACSAAEDPSRGLELLRERRLLCAQHHGPRGAVEIGVAAERELIRAGRLDLRGAAAGHGQPVMITRNDASQDLYNGDIALLWRGREGLHAAVDQGEGRPPRLVAPPRLPPHEPAYAITIHKSQGSQFGAVSVVLPESGSPLLTRELLYTALTRARHAVRLYASRDAVRACVTQPARRASGLRRRMMS